MELKQFAAMYDDLKSKTLDNESAGDEALSESVSNRALINELLVMDLSDDKEDEKHNEEKESGRPDYLKSSDNHWRFCVGASRFT